jgi:uncharacterized protein (DUF1778 family)
MASARRQEAEESQKTARLEARITLEQKELFTKAATLVGRSLSDFVVTSVSETAVRTVREHDVMALTTRDREIFVNALLNPPLPGARLRKSARRYKERAGE